MIQTLCEQGIGECTVRGELPPRRQPWFYDNGAFKDFKAGRSFDEKPFLRDLDILASLDMIGAHSADRPVWLVEPPQWIVVPDIVAGGLLSLDFSLSWEPRCRGLAPLYLAVQDGMTPADVERVLPRFQGIFVGGSTEWKMDTGAAWVAWGHARGRPVHIGRVGTARRVRWALTTGCDSIDSSLPLRSKDNLRVFLAALNGG